MPFSFSPTQPICFVLAFRSPPKMLVRSTKFDIYNTNLEYSTYSIPRIFWHRLKFTYSELKKHKQRDRHIHFIQKSELKT
ncbi:hypothetical protein BpHYR1_046614 [Brachionus plicatilis]|uniref:Uncharacterized protein n=1 Tax=Brachionus plicatilis TaxID=10195 RepID=A0A3M7RAP4_BRAPC|nr:hypothetical protein BpHYR1_046614 [Brachionus plicatilis]